MKAGGRAGPTLRALWNLRALGLFLIGPMVGVGLGAAVFGMPGALIGVAVVMFMVSLGMFAMLVRGERRRLVSARRPPVS